MIRVAGSTFAFGDLSLEESVDILRDLGFTLADVGASGWCTYKEIVPQQVVKNLDEPDREAERIRKVTQQRGLGVSELFVCDFGEFINHPDPAERKRSRDMFAKMSRIGQKAGFESIMMIPGEVHEALGQTPEEAFETSTVELRAMVDIAEENGVRCNVEPCVGSIAVHPDDALRLVEAVPGLGLTLDYAHQVQLGLGHDEIEVLHPYARHFHAKQSAPGSWQARTDEGVIDFGRLIRKLKADNYDGVISVEFVTTPEVLDAGWDLKAETARLKKVVEEAVAA